MTYNERENITILVEKIHAALAGYNYDILFVDDNSGDGTAEVAVSLSAKYPVRVIVRRNERGLASAVVHEVPDPERFFSEIHAVLKPGGMFLVLEPRGHVSVHSMEENIARARSAGFAEAGRPRVNMSRTVLLLKN